MTKRVCVTGAFSYSGSYIAEAFLEHGWQVTSLTRNPKRQHRLQDQLKAFPLDFSDQDSIVNSLKGVDVLVNTYWVRFDYGQSSFAQAVENSRMLFSAAKEAGVKRIIHLSVSNPDINSDLPYYAGKAQVESALHDSGVDYSILRPTLIFGEEEILISNITWLLRKLPIFAIPGDGQYLVQPIFVRDLAALAVNEAHEKGQRTINAAAQEVLTYNQLIQLLQSVVDSSNVLIQLPPAIVIAFSRLLGFILLDVLLTRDELDGLMQERLYVGDESLQGKRFSDWARANASELGRNYRHEIKRHHQSV